MSSQQNELAIILKKNPFGEADEIITAFGHTAGKFRFLAKAVKKHNAKLQNSLQQFFLVRLDLVFPRSGNSLQKAFGAEVKATFPNIREDIFFSQAAFYAAEIFLKFMPDGENNPELFLLLKEFLFQLNTCSPHEIFALVAWLQAGFLGKTGYGILPEGENFTVSDKEIFLSPKLGKFLPSYLPGSIRTTPKIVELYEKLKSTTHLSGMDLSRVAAAEAEDLCLLLNGFLEQILERNIKAASFLKKP